MDPGNSTSNNNNNNNNNNQPSPAVEAVNGTFKRKRSPSAEPPSAPVPPAKTAKTHSTHLQINYLARQYSDILPVVSIEDNLPTVLQLLGDYSGVLERHESLAGNLGARPLGPMLIKRFERLFDAPPRVLKSHGKEGTFVTWLDVVEFARHKPEQFNLEKMRDGVRVCQFYTKQSRVEISEDDYLLIDSGMPQKLIPPQPIPEDEEKELGTLEIMEKSISQIIQLAEQVSIRARQFKHRLTSRKNAIVNRRENEAALAAETAAGTPNAEADQPGLGSPTSASGFVAVNRSTKEAPANGAAATTNGRSSVATASAVTRAELLNAFNIVRERQASQAENVVMGDTTPTGIPRSNNSKPKPKPTGTTDMEYVSNLLNSASPVPIPGTPSNLVSHYRPTAAERLDDSGPYKAEMLSRMETLQRGDRVLPPCDRCRRLHMDCLKNLTACQGCTRKHAKCSWKDVTDQELTDNPRAAPKEGATVVNGDGTAANPAAARSEGPPQPVRDEELLGEDESDDETRPPTSVANRSVESEPTSKIISLKISPKVSPGLTKQAELTAGLTTPGQNIIDTALSQLGTSHTSTEPNKVDQAKTDNPTPEARAAAPEDVQARAREILQKRLAEIPAVNASNGFEPVNRPSAEPMPEVRIHEPLPESRDSPRSEGPLPAAETRHVTPPEPKTETFHKPAVDAAAAVPTPANNKPFGANYQPYE